MDVKSSQGKVEGEVRAPAESPRRLSSFYSLRSTSLLIDDHQDCRSLSHLGILMPLYLTPLFFLGTKYGGCLYCLLLPLLLWAFNSLPKASAALVHLVTVPLLGLMAPEEIARQYFCPDVLTLALVLFLVIVVDRWSELVLSLANAVCVRFGLQRKRLFLGTCLCSFAFAWLFSGPLVSVTLLYFLDRVLSTIHRENMDRTPEAVARSPRRGSLQESSSLRSLTADDQVLFDRLAQLAMLMKKPERTRWRRKQQHAEEGKKEPDAGAAPTASGMPDVPQEQTQALSASLPVPAAVQPTAFDWTTGTIAEPPSELLTTELYARGPPALPPETALVPLDVTDREGALNPAQPLRSVQESELLQKEEGKLPQNQRELQALLPLPSMPAVPLEERGDKQVTTRSAVDSSPNTKRKSNRQRTLNAMIRRNTLGHKSRPATRDADGAIPVHPSKTRHKLFRSLSALASRLTRKRTRDTQFQMTDLESARRDNATGAPALQLHRNGESPQPVLASEIVAPVGTADGGSFRNNSQPGNAVVPREPVRSTKDDSIHSSAAPAQPELALLPYIQATGTVTDSVIHPASAPFDSGTQIDLLKALPPTVTDPGPYVTAGPELLKKWAEQGTKAGRTGPVNGTNLPCEKANFAKSDSENLTAKSGDSVPRQQTAPSDKPSVNHPPNLESKMAAEEHPQPLEPVLITGGDERQYSKGSSANPSLTFGQQEDEKASECFRCGEKGASHDARSCAATPTERKADPSVTGTEDPGPYFTRKDPSPSHSTEKCPQNKSTGSLGKPLHDHSPRRKNATSVRKPTGGSQAFCAGKKENSSRKSSATDISANKDRSPAMKASSGAPSEKKHQAQSSGHKDDPVQRGEKSRVKGSEERQRNKRDDNPEKRKEKQRRKSSKDSLNKQAEGIHDVPAAKKARHAHRKGSKTNSDTASSAGAAKEVSARDAQNPHRNRRQEVSGCEPQAIHPQASKIETPAAVASDSKRMDHHQDKTGGSADSRTHKTELTIKTNNSLPDKHVRDKRPSAHLEADKPVATAAPEAKSRRGSTRERHRGSNTDTQSSSSRRSKTSVKSRHGSDVQEAKDRAPGTTKVTTEDGEQDVPSKLTTIDKAQTQHRAETKHAPKGASARKSTTLAEAEHPLQSAGQAPSEETRHSQDSKLKPGVVPPGPEAQQAASSANALKASVSNGADTINTTELRRKYSIVSFGADSLGTIKPQPVPSVPMVSAQADEAAAGHLQVRRLSTILKPSSLTAAAPRPRRRSSVDFGSTKFTIISPLQKPAGAPPPRRHSMSSRVSTGSLTSLAGGSEGLGYGRAPITLRRMTRTRSCGFEDTISRPFITSQINHGPSFLKKKSNSARADVHNAFLLGSSLMTVLGNLCSFHSSGYKAALRAVSPTGDTAGQFVSGFTWAIVTLPGALMALVTCTIIIWLVYIRPHEPEPLSPDNLVVITNARERAANTVKRRGVECAYAAYLVILGLSYVPPLVLGLEPRMTLVVTLASLILVTSSLTSCLRAAFEFIRNIWQMLPWGVLLLLGATHVASEVVQVNAVLIEAFSMVPISFWEERTLLEVQTMLAFAASIMAEATDKQVLLDILMPVVVRISQMKQMHPVYYAIPVLVGASSNVIMPSSVPTALMHDLSRVPFWKLLLLGLFAKIVVMSMVIVTVNMMDRVGLLTTDALHE